MSDNDNLDADYSPDQGPPLTPFVVEPEGYDMDDIRINRMRGLVGAIIRSMMQAEDGTIEPNLTVTPGTWGDKKVTIISIIVPKDHEPDGLAEGETATLPVAVLLGEYQEFELEPDANVGRKALNPQWMSPS